MIALEEVAGGAESLQADYEVQFKADLIDLIPFLQAFSKKLIRRRALSEDILQDALTNAWKARASYQPGTNLKAWLCTILRNEYSTQQRRAWRQVPWDANAAATIHAPVGEQHWASELTDIRRALVRLRAEQREAFILVVVGGYSYDEAALIAKVPVGTLKSRVSRSRASIGKILKQGIALPKRKRSSQGGALHEFMAELSCVRISEDELAPLNANS